MKKIQFRVEDEDHDYLLVCLKSIYPDEPNLTVAKGMKLLASALLKSKDKKIEESIIDDNDDFIKTTLYLTATQRSKIEKSFYSSRLDYLQRMSIQNTNHT